VAGNKGVEMEKSRKKMDKERCSLGLHKEDTRHMMLSSL
jgi:hypothetical protein